MLRFTLGCVASVAVLFAGVRIVGEDNSLALLGVGLVAMIVLSFGAPHYFYYGEPLFKPSKRTGG